MNFEIIVLVAFLAFLSFLALLAYLKFCESHKNDLSFKVERAEQNILKSFQNLIDQVSRPSSRSRSSSSSSSSTNSSSSSSSGFHSVSRGPIRGGAEGALAPPRPASPEYEDISDPEDELNEE